MSKLEHNIQALLKNSDFSDRTLGTYLKWNLRFIDIIKKDKLDEINFEDIKKFSDFLNKSKYSDSSKRQAISALEIVFNKNLKRNFNFKSIKVSRPIQKTPIVIPKKNILSIISSINNLKEKTTIALTYSLGLTPDEVISLRVGDYDEINNKISIRKKGKIYRKTTVGISLAKTLNEYLIKYNPRIYLIENSNTKDKYTATSISNIFKKHRDRLGLDKRYTLKHLKYSYVKHLVDEGFQLTDVLNHMKLKNYEVYSRIKGLNNKISFSPIDSLDNNDKKLNLKVTDEQIKNFEFTKTQTFEILKSNQNLIKSFIENDITDSDIVSIAYRKKQIDKFEKLLTNETFFNKELKKLGNNSKENLWQKFFEENTWIFGYGLNFIFTSKLENKKLEQVVSGYDFNQGGKRVDGLLKTKGLISSLCFLEIKTHDTNLLKTKQYRNECWNVSDDLTGAISQIQKTVQKAISNLPTQNNIKDSEGNPTNETVFLYQPKSFLIVGNLNQFKNDYGINESKFSSFELFRQNINYPEIITYDELFERAKFLIRNK